MRIAPNKKLQSRTNRKGLTLIELLVVLVILVALAGILIPILPNVVQQSHGAAGADNIKEVAKAIQLHQATTGVFPDGWDSLIDGDEETLSDEHLAILETTDLPGLTASLLAAGITTSYQHATFSTFDGIDYENAPTALAGGIGEVVQLTDEAEEELGLIPSISSGGTSDIQTYIAFGLGGRSTAIGRSMVDAPVHFPEAGDSPLTLYSRFVVVFAVPVDGPIRLATVAAAHRHDDEVELSGLSQHMAEYYEARQ